ncbi:LacI family DNA-binding transcriptional regulator [Ruegeria sp. HKCCD4884]|uniref:substrate-binding domain-containing protein n=1 Tax=Ruegeria sp. HKCCD4884 TaxID=2683022 RepID=UPI001490E84A|nr:LacI family DNA-binding transcriptional regulator [Ruegeria sp. HKCCD4884]NOD94540.1 LacI family DNA-binding transcriptional regulator [Ruegeria sp. HKCCD4884]
MAKTDTNKQVTIYDIADRAGTSASTVGAVLNGSWRNRRISEERANTIRKLASEMGYAPNMQARALRSVRSSMIGMIIPMYDNRYFGAIAERFETASRARGLLPMTSCTHREPELELATVRQMLSYNVDHIVCTGASDPDGIAEICRAQNVPTINLDLPGTAAPSIISDNYSGAYKLTEALIERADAKGLNWQDEFLFVGGRPTDHNTSERIRGFKDAFNRAGARPIEDNILACGYAASKSKAAFSAKVKASGRMPTAMFVNSTISLEGVFEWLAQNDRAALDTILFGSFDWDPFAQYMAQNLFSVRQDVTAMVDTMFQVIDNAAPYGSDVIHIQPIVMSEGT